MDRAVTAGRELRLNAAAGNAMDRDGRRLVRREAGIRAKGHRRCGERDQGEAAAEGRAREAADWERRSKHGPRLSEMPASRRFQPEDNSEGMSTASYFSVGDAQRLSRRP